MRVLLVVMACAGCRYTPQEVGDVPGDGNADSSSDSDAAQASCEGTSGLASICLVSPQPNPVVFDSDTTIDTDVAGNCATLTPTSSDVCVIDGPSIAIGATLAAVGSRPLVLIAGGQISITGSLDVASHLGGTIGAGADLPGCVLGTPPGFHGGGAGGSFGSLGGNGGNSNGELDRGLQGTTITPTSLRGGCPGAGDLVVPTSNGRGGGAVLLIASAIDVPVGGEINASGSAGIGAAGKHGTGGGGSGGMIVLDAPTIAIAGDVYANGGGGGGGGGNGAGSDGSDPGPTGAAPGGPRGSSAGDGGTGSAFAGPGGDGGNGTNSTDGGGGGGGGAGVIRVFRYTGALGGTVSPPPS